ncbi:TIGR02530 family flagellar biosynthesis protein [Falsibacillus albus]|uniref:Flagellar protein n=1 Tax=Falsibacillus albus TaxID=2478915 RepID=A0A3L7JYX7_9BACI|nr:TIGR02530 family flagellar biosynthesis protein [Falsibacillus albus]RLQ95740.1 flagellar protein [Falsibacillus albus]
MDRNYIHHAPSQPVASHIHTPKQLHKSVQSGLFQQQLQKAIASNESQLSISKHASQRLKMRGIELAANQWKQITYKVQEAREKGVTDSLVILPNAALIVSAKNRTVITAMSRQEAQSQIFTNINGTILIDE